MVQRAVNLARVVKVINLGATPKVQVNLSVVDNGGSTDVEPTQEMFLNLYAKGAAFDTDAIFPLGSAYEVKSGKRTATGLLELKVVLPDENGLPKARTMTIDARKATAEIQAVTCTDEFDCPASEDFKSTVEVTVK